MGRLKWLLAGIFCACMVALLLPVSAKAAVASDTTVLDFGSVQEGYDAPDEQTITFTNTGNTTYLLSENTYHHENYIITLSPIGHVANPNAWVIEAYSTVTATFQPKAGLSPGVYDVLLTYGIYDILPSIEIKFTVLPAETPPPTPTASPSPTVAPTPTVTPTVTPTPAKSYTVTYNGNGGTIGGKTSVTKTVTTGSKYVLPATPVQADYTFAGWYTAMLGGDRVTSNTVFTQSYDMILFAQWTSKYTSVYSLYNKNNGEHFFTATVSERDNLVSAGWKYEGIAWKAPRQGNPVYRLYEPASGAHLYTRDASERSNLLKLGWKNEGTAWYSDPAQKRPIYRLYNKNATAAAAHHYTVNATERDNLVKAGWKYEGIAFYGA
ncbi:MAG: InlB B-repeat-containing protein [Lachnospiraceae bacterium]